MRDSMTLEFKVLDAYLGFEIRSEAEGLLSAVPSFWCAEEPVLAARSMPELRKRIWQWWHLFDGQR